MTGSCLELGLGGVFTRPGALGQEHFGGTASVSDTLIGEVFKNVCDAFRWVDRKPQTDQN